MSEAATWTGSPPKGDLGDIPFLRPHPGAGGFRRRAERLAALAPGHPAGDFLALVGRVAAAQHAAAAAPVAPAAAPAGRPLDGSRPPEGWREILATLAAALSGVPMPPEARAAVASLRRPAADLDALATRLLAGEPATSDLAAAPFVGAALQVVFAGQAAALDPAAVARPADVSCPVCGQPPTVGVVMGDDKLRYLVCGLCGTEWHRTRLECVVCRSGARVTYLALDGQDGPARAEACDACEAYLKLLYREKAPDLEPLADDLASLALDLLVADRGHLRVGRNPYLASAGG